MSWPCCASCCACNDPDGHPFPCLHDVMEGALTQPVLEQAA